MTPIRKHSRILLTTAPVQRELGSFNKDMSESDPPSSEETEKATPSAHESADQPATGDANDGERVGKAGEKPSRRSAADELEVVLETTEKAKPKEEPAIRRVPLTEEEARDAVAIADGIVAEPVELTTVSKPESIAVAASLSDKDQTEDTSQKIMDTEKEATDPLKEPAGSEEAPPAEEPRREFLQKAGSMLVGGAITVVPAGIGLRVVADPLFRSQVGGVAVRLTTLDSLETGGPPRAFKVVADKTDAWTTYKNLPLGLVYAQRISETKVTVFSASCPHAGCAVEYRKDGEIAKKKMGEHYYCPCHESAFGLDGVIATDGSPAERPLDALVVDEEKLNQGEVWVKFQRFKAGIAEKQAI